LRYNLAEAKSDTFATKILMAGKRKDKAQVHKELDGLNITVNEFGEIKMNKSSEELNKFLNENVKDKKLIDREESDK